MTALIPLILSVAFTSHAAHAQVFKCPKPGGGTTYSDQPCISTNGTSVNLTNARQPVLRDQINATVRALDNKITLMKQEQAERQQRQRDKNCNRARRDAAATFQTAAKYPNDLWWQNRVADHNDAISEACQ